MNMYMRICLLTFFCQRNDEIVSFPIISAETNFKIIVVFRWIPRWISIEQKGDYYLSCLGIVLKLAVKCLLTFHVVSIKELKINRNFMDKVVAINDVANHDNSIII